MPKQIKSDSESTQAAEEETVTESNNNKRTLLCVADGKAFRVTIPPKAKVTFAPWAPSGDAIRDHSKNRGTLRIYSNKAPNADIIFVKSGVTEFRELDAIEYEEATEEVVGSRVWRSDKHGHVLHEEVKRNAKKWSSDPPLPSLPASQED